MKFLRKKNVPNQEMELANLKKEIKLLKLKRERELVLAQATKQKRQLLNEINSLKKTQNPSNFGKNMLAGVKIVGRGIQKGLEGIRSLDNPQNYKPQKYIKQSVKEKPLRKKIQRPIQEISKVKPWELP